MQRFWRVVIVMALCVIGLGFYRGWFVLSSHNRDTGSHKVDVNLTVDPDKMKQDGETVKEKVTELTGTTKAGGTDSGIPASDNAKAKPQ